MSLTLLRHAPPPLEYQKRYIGHTDISIDLTLFNPLLLPYMYDFIYSSDLCRCTQTLKNLGYPIFQSDQRLREVRFKKPFEGKKFEEIAQMKVYTPIVLQSQESWYDFICDEPLREFHKRITAFLHEIPEDKNILICSHAGTIQQILTLLGEEPKQLDYLEYTIVTVK
ncbi:histidine phosphatase family protein [Sulfuricurvum sp.]|uniref:histidine phosphatase family protein n=1 Tax=Sulfuricurvum sp. TaxID=2025608 RepID=UPI003BB60676